ncbi:MAG: hypothetical protein U0T80_01485 [Flavobacteriaceae bacterium]
MITTEQLAVRGFEFNAVDTNGLGSMSCARLHSKFLHKGATEAQQGTNSITNVSGYTNGANQPANDCW